MARRLDGNSARAKARCTDWDAMPSANVPRAGASVIEISGGGKENKKRKKEVCKCSNLVAAKSSFGGVWGVKNAAVFAFCSRWVIRGLPKCSVVECACGSEAIGAGSWLVGWSSRASGQFRLTAAGMGPELRDELGGGREESTAHDEMGGGRGGKRQTSTAHDEENRSSWVPELRSL